MIVISVIRLSSNAMASVSVAGAAGCNVCKYKSDNSFLSTLVEPEGQICHDLCYFIYN